MAGKPGLDISPLAVPLPAMPPVRGVELATAHAGMYAHERDDVLLMRCAPGTACAGVFTRHRVGSAPVDWCMETLKGGGADVRGVVVNAGCANSFTGAPGAAAARRVAEAAGKAIGCAADQVMLSSTGVIGVLLPDAKITARMSDLAAGLKADAWGAAAHAIMTTDTFPKGATAEAEIDGVKVRINGVAKGSGMIAPDMATMLAYVATDANIAPPVLRSLLRRLTPETFNAVTVDGDRSTNDTLLLFATGQAGGPRISRATDPRLADFTAKLRGVLLDLAMQLVRDGEGASKFVKVTITGAISAASARRIARTVCESPLVKTAFAGEDANWGRIVMAVGRADEPIDRSRIRIAFGPHVAAEHGRIADAYSEEAMSAYMKNPELEVAVDVGVGTASAAMWTCDLTKQYVAINGDYRS